MVESAHRSDTDDLHLDAAHLSSAFPNCLASSVLHHRNDTEPLISCTGGTDCHKHDRGDNVTTRGAPTDSGQDRRGPAVRRGNHESYSRIRTAHSHRWALR